MKKRAYLFLAFAIITAIPIACKKENPNVKKGKEFLEIEEFESAQKEFKIALKNEPKNVEAKGLLIYTNCRLEPYILGKIYIGLGAKVLLCEDAEMDRWANKEKIEKLKVQIRNEFYKMGIETKNWQELTQIIKIAGKEAFKTKVPEEGEGKRTMEVFKLIGAIAEGREGNEEAVRFLLKMSKEEDFRDLAIDALARIGLKSLPILKREIQNKESLFRKEASKAYRIIKAISSLSTFMEKHPDVRGIRAKQVPEKIWKEMKLEEVSYWNFFPSSGTFFYCNPDTLGRNVPLYMLLSDTIKNLHLLFWFGTLPKENRFFFSPFVWNEGKLEWQPAKIKKLTSEFSDIYSSNHPLFIYNLSNDTLQVAEVSSETVTKYKIETDWSTYPPTEKRVPYTEEALSKKDIVFLYKDGVFIQQKVAKKEEEKKGGKE